MSDELFCLSNSDFMAVRSKDLRLPQNFVRKRTFRFSVIGPSFYAFLA